MFDHDHEDTPLGSALREAASDYKHGFKIDVIRENFDAIEWALSLKREGKRLRIKTVVEIINKKFGLDLEEDTFRNYLSRVRKERKGRPGEERRTAAAPPIILDEEALGIERTAPPTSGLSLDGQRQHNSNQATDVHRGATVISTSTIYGKKPAGVSPQRWHAMQAEAAQRKRKP